MNVDFPFGDPRWDRSFSSQEYTPPQTVGHYFSGFDGQRIDDLTKALNRLAEAIEKRQPLRGGLYRE